MEVDSAEYDPVVREMDVYLSQDQSNFFLLQYPLRPSHAPFTSDNVLAARVCGEGEGVELDIKVRPRGENYSTSQGEHFAQLVAMGSQNGANGGRYESDMFDKLTLSSTPTSLKAGRYAVAAFKEGSLHITPLQGVVQLKPNLSYLDRADVGAKKLEAAASDDGGDTTESEGEEAKPVTVRFAKPVNPAKAEKKVGHKLTFTESSNVPKVWTTVAYHGVESEEAEEERALLFAVDDDQTNRFGMPEEKYLDLIFPKEACHQEENGNGTSGQPIGVVSLESIRKLPLKKQVLEVLRSAHMIQFGQLCSLLGVSGGKMASVLEAVLSCGVLVQGCWVVASQVLYPDPSDTAKRTARDYMLWCFSQRRLVPRKDIMGVVKLPNEEVRQMMKLLADQKFIPQQGWEFRLETDNDFIARNNSMVSKEEDKWRRKHKELVNEINMKSPGSASKPGPVAFNTPPDVPTGSGRDSGKGQRKGKGKRSNIEAEGGGAADTELLGPKLSVTPSRHTSSLTPHTIPTATNGVSMDTGSVVVDTGPVPMDTSSVVAPMETELASKHIGTAGSILSPTHPTSSGMPALSPVLQRALNLNPDPNNQIPQTEVSRIPSTSNSHPSVKIKQERADTPINQPDVIVKHEKPSTELEAALVEFCEEALGRGVLSLAAIRDKLLLKQTSVSQGHPLREQGVSDSQLESGLRLCGAVEVGQPVGRRLFALTHGNQCRATALEMFQRHKSLKKKQLIDELESREIIIPEKIVLKALKELCYGKGGHWRILGT